MDTVSHIWLTKSQFDHMSFATSRLYRTVFLSSCRTYFKLKRILNSLTYVYFFFVSLFFFVFFFKQKTAYEMRISDWSSDVCSSDLSGRWNRRRGSAGPTGGALQPRWPGVERRRQGGLAAPLLSRTAALDRRGLGEQTSGMDGCLVRERGQVNSSWHRYPGSADTLFEEHELRLVLARRYIGSTEAAPVGTEGVMTRRPRG